MCDCLKDLEQQIKEKYQEKTGKEIEDVSFQVNLLNSQTYTDVYIKFKNQKKEKTIVMVHSYCPICGEKYKTDEPFGELNKCKFPGCNIFGCTKLEHGYKEK